MLEYKQLMKVSYGKNWINGCSKEFAKLTQGRKKYNTKGTNTIFSICPNRIPKNKKPTYISICTNCWPQNEDPYRVRWTVGGNLINYQVETYAPIYDITTANLLLNSIITTNGARFTCIYLSNFYLITPFNNRSDYKYLWISEWVIYEDIMEEYNLKPLIKMVVF